MTWFSSPSGPGLSTVLRCTDAAFFVDAEQYYADLRHEVEASGRGDWVFWIGFDAGGYDGSHSVVKVPMPALLAGPPPARKPFPPRAWQTTDLAWFDVLAAAANERGVNVRALLNLHPSPRPPDRYKPGNLDLVRQLNGLRNTLAIDDFRFLWMNGTHHQKLVLVRNRNGLSAYVGTMDVHFQRIVDRWCELQCRLRGAVARELYRVFHDRYMEHTAVFQRAGSERSYVPPPEQIDVDRGGGGKIQVRCATTYGNPQRANPFRVVGPRQQVVNEPHRIVVTSRSVLPLVFLSGGPPKVEVGNDFFLERDPAAPPLIAEARQQTPRYAFAPQGHFGIHRLILDAIANTAEVIYLEDQYLVCDEPMGTLPSLLGLLESKVKERQFKKLVVLHTRLDELEIDLLGLAGIHRRRFIERLVAAGGDKVVFCQYKSRRALGIAKPDDSEQDKDRSPFYVHSKTWIFDDAYLVTGSANCNRRGYSHDSELDVGVYLADDPAVRDLRIRLWLSRLNTEKVPTPVTWEQVTDPVAGARFWERPGEHGLTIENHRIGLDAFLPGSREKPIVLDSGGYGPAVDLVALAGGVKDKIIWDVVVDPDGT